MSMSTQFILVPNVRPLNLPGQRAFLPADPIIGVTHSCLVDRAAALLVKEQESWRSRLESVDLPPSTPQ